MTSPLITKPRLMIPKLIVPTVSGACEDTTCDTYDLLGDGVMAQVISEATSNLLPETSRSFEDGAPGAWVGGYTTPSQSDDWAWHGSYSGKLDFDGVGKYVQATVTAWTLASTQYTLSGWWHNDSGGTITMVAGLWDADGGWQWGSDVDIPDGETKFVHCTKTYGTGGTRKVQFYNYQAGLMYVDGIMLENKAYPTWFSNGDRTAMSSYVPIADTGLYVGGPQTFISAWLSLLPSSSGVFRTFWDYAVAAGSDRVNCTLETNNNMYYYTRDSVPSGGGKVGANPSWSAGDLVVVICRRDALGNHYFDVNGNSLTSNYGTPPKQEDSHPTNLYLGSSYVPSLQVNGPLHTSFANRCMRDDEVAAIFSMLGVT